MKKPLFLALALMGGTAVGGGSAFALDLFLPSEPPPLESDQDLNKSIYVPVDPILVPLITEDGRLTTYVSIELSLAVAAEEQEAVKSRLPLLMDAINVRTYRQPLATGPDGRLPDLAAFRKLVLADGKRLLGAAAIRSVAITKVDER